MFLMLRKVSAHINMIPGVFPCAALVAKHNPFHVSVQTRGNFKYMPQTLLTDHLYSAISHITGNICSSFHAHANIQSGEGGSAPVLRLTPTFILHTAPHQQDKQGDDLTSGLKHTLTEMIYLHSLVLG